MRDSSYNCNYCHGKKHLAKECMQRRLKDKKEGEDDEAYYLRKLQEIKRKKNADNTMHALIFQENEAEDEFGRVEVWSTDSEDEEVRRPSHGRSFIAKDEGLQLHGRCLMVTSEVSELRGYATDGRCGVHSCFAAKPVPEQISECEQVIKKVNSILESLNISVS